MELGRSTTSSRARRIRSRAGGRTVRTIRSFRSAARTISVRGGLDYGTSELLHQPVARTSAPRALRGCHRDPARTVQPGAQPLVWDPAGEAHSVGTWVFSGVGRFARSHDIPRVKRVRYRLCCHVHAGRTGTYYNETTIGSFAASEHVHRFVNSGFRATSQWDQILFATCSLPRRRLAVSFRYARAGRRSPSRPPRHHRWFKDPLPSAGNSQCQRGIPSCTTTTFIRWTLHGLLGAPAEDGLGEYSNGANITPSDIASLVLPKCLGHDWTTPSRTTKC